MEKQSDMEGLTVEQMGGLLSAGHFNSRDEVERDAPRKVGSWVDTPCANYVYDGKQWVMFAMCQFIPFKVLSRHYVVGRGHVTVVHNPDLLPIDCHKSAICQGPCLLPIRGIERSMTLMTIPKVKPHWGLLTSEETKGDWLTIRMYPDPIEEPENINSNVMRCINCGAENPDARKTCSECGAFLEGYTLNNVTGEYGYRGADGNFYKSEEEYRSQSSAAVQSAIDHAKVELRLKIAEIMKRATQEKLNPLVSQMTALISEAFQVGFDAGMECGRYTDYSTKED